MGQEIQMVIAMALKEMGMREKTPGTRINTMSVGRIVENRAENDAKMPQTRISTLYGGIPGKNAENDAKMPQTRISTLCSSMRIYICGPVTGTEDYMERFARAEDALRKEGYTAVNPVKVNAQLPEGTSHSEYMKMSLAMLDMCDAIFMMDGWQESKGCAIEFEYAYGHRHIIMFEGGRG